MAVADIGLDTRVGSPSPVKEAVRGNAAKDPCDAAPSSFVATTAAAAAALLTDTAVDAADDFREEDAEEITSGSVIGLSNCCTSGCWVEALDE